MAAHTDIAKSKWNVLENEATDKAAALTIKRSSEPAKAG